MILGCILVAGLWPFHSPINGVNWRQDGKGLHFGLRASIMTPAMFPPDAAEGRSLEIRLLPAFVPDSSTFLSFSTPAHPRQIWMGQSVTDLYLQKGKPDGIIRGPKIYVDEVFRRGEEKLITVTSGATRTVVYIDGRFAKGLPQFQITAQDLEGNLIVGDSSVQNDNWSGDVFGLAIYDRELTAAEVQQHYRAWKDGKPPIRSMGGLKALYLFNEGSGRVVHNVARQGADLEIPERYQVVRQVLLETMRSGNLTSWGYWKDVIINVAGFMPLGVCYCWYMRFALRMKRAALWTILFGFSLSAGIETLQSVLPTRDSDMTDVFTNSLGTCLGVLLYCSAPIQHLLERVDTWVQETTGF